MSKNTLVEEAYVIARAMYEAADAILADFDDEEFRTVSKLKNSANDAYFYVAQVEGAGRGQAQDYECIYARQQLYILRAMYVFAGKQGLLDIDPHLIVKIDSLIEKMDLALKDCKDEVKRKTAEEIEPWLEKYRIWQKITKK